MKKKKKKKHLLFKAKKGFCSVLCFMFQNFYNGLEVNVEQWNIDSE